MSNRNITSTNVHLGDGGDIDAVCYKVNQNIYAVEIASVTFFGTKSQLAELFANATNSLSDPQ